MKMLYLPIWCQKFGGKNMVPNHFSCQIFGTKLVSIINQQNEKSTFYSIFTFFRLLWGTCHCCCVWYCMVFALVVWFVFVLCEFILHHFCTCVECITLFIVFYKLSSVAIWNLCVLSHLVLCVLNCVECCTKIIMFWKYNCRKKHMPSCAFKLKCNLIFNKWHKIQCIWM